MSILFRTKEWLTVAQLARAWTAEIPGAKQDPQQFEQELVHLLLEDIVNKRLDDTGPLAEGRRLGLRVITSDGRAGFLEGHQVQDLLLPDGALTFFLHRIVVMKEAALDFARRHELPLPSWWTDAFAASTKPANHLTPDGIIPIPCAASQNPVGAGLSRPRTGQDDLPPISRGIRHQRACPRPQSQNICTKARTYSTTDKTRGGIPFEKGALSYFLRNRFFIGEVKGEVLPGEQPPILDKSLFEAVQQKLSAHQSHKTLTRQKSDHLLKDLLSGHRVIATRATKTGVRYRCRVGGGAH
jgi:hypothetical protein